MTEPGGSGVKRTVTRWRLARHAVRLGAVVAIVGAVPLQLASQARAQEASVLAFRGSAAASAVQLKVTIPGFPATDTPFDGGGPTAQASLSSIGDSTGFASFPDPGSLAVTLPGLVSGLLGSGAAGLPPINLPLPDYPLSISSNLGTRPDATLGAGPYVLEAHSEEKSTTAKATFGFSTGTAGNAALLTSNANMAVKDGNTVVASATTSFEGLTIGPLQIGQVISTAKMTMAPDGSVTPSTNMEIAALRIAGLPIAIGRDSLNILGVSTPLPINDTLKSLLGAAGIKMTVLAAQEFDDRVVAPALAIEMPVNLPVGTGAAGTATLTIGFASASLGAGGAEVPTDIPVDGGAVDLGGSTPIPDLGSELPTFDSPALPSPGAPVGTTPRVQPATSQTPVGTFDIRVLYLLVVGGAALAFTDGHLVKSLGRIHA